MKILDYLYFALLVTSCLSLLPLAKQKIGKNYQIGTIQSLSFIRGKDQILFKADSDLLGLIDHLTGQIIYVYQLEKDEEIVKYQSEYVIITKNKKINFFIPYHRNYVRSPATIFLERHPNFTKLIDARRSYKNSLYLTDRYLMNVKHIPNENNIQKSKEQILIELQDKSQTFFNIVPFAKSINKTQVTHIEIVTSIKKTDTLNQVCIRNIQDLKQTPKCYDIDKGDNVVDIETQNYQFIIELENYILVLSKDLEFIQKINQKAVQYHGGFVTIGSNHKIYEIRTKKILDFRVIVQNHQVGAGLMFLKVQEKSMTLQNITFKEKSQESVDLITISKGQDQIIRKVWSHTNKDNILELHLYVEFYDGRLVSYLINKQTKRYEVSWELTTITAKKTVVGQLEADDIDQDPQNDKKEDIQENQEAQKKP